MLNSIVIMGRLTRDCELRRTNSGKPVASFTIAVDRDYNPDGGEKQTDFIDIVAWNGTAEFVDKYFGKGSMIVVQGRLQLRDWTDKEGNKRRSAEVVASDVWFGNSKRSSENNGQSYGGGNNSTQGFQQPQNRGYQQSQQGYPQQQYGAPQYNQQGFGGYQQPGFQGQVYQPNQPGNYAQIQGDDEKLPF